MAKELTTAQLARRSLSKTYRKDIWNPFVQAMKTYRLVSPGDRVAVCISGGKDSMLLAVLMEMLQKYSDFPFEVVNISMDPGYNAENRRRIEENAEKLELPLTFFETDIFNVAEKHGGESPCYLCARMRRGYLYAKAQELGCNKIALGHHRTDVLETTLLSMFYGGQMQTMPPRLKSTSHPGMELIRPLYCVDEADILRWCAYNDLHFIRCACRFTEAVEAAGADSGFSKRQEMKELLRELKKTNPNIENSMFNSIHNVHLDTFVGYRTQGEDHFILERFEADDPGDPPTEGWTSYTRKKATNMKYPTIKKEYPSVLSDWGPFSKHLAGVSHIENDEKGELLEFCVFPAQYRGSLQLPMEVYQCNHYPWYAQEDLKFYTYRFELEWKDRVYADVSYWVKDDKTVLMRAECVNDTDMTQNLCLHTLANRYRPAMAYAKGTAVAVDPLAYDSLDICGENRLSGLTPDGKLLGEVLGGQYVNGHALGDIFAKTVGDKATYTVSAPGANTLYVRASGKGKLIAGGVCTAEIAPGGNEFVLLSFPLNADAGELTLTCAEPGVMVDYIGLGKADEVPTFTTQGPAVRPQIKENGATVVMTYEEMKNCYGMAWQADLYEVREFLTDRLEYDMPFNTHNHVSKVIGNGSNQYTNVFIRPIPLEARETKTFYAMFTCGGEEEVNAALAGFDAEAIAAAFPTVPADEGTYALSQRLMHATLLTNVVYPVRLQGRYVRHFTPGAWWDSLYTWDNGFIAMGLSDIAPELALECLHTYTTEPGNPHCAFIHHGSMVPVQAYVYKKIFDATGDREFLKEYYDSMRQYYDFYSGRSPLSHTKDLNSGLVCTFRYFYNSGGWDDYPPQHAIFGPIMQALRSGDRAAMGKAIAAMSKTDRYATASNTAHAINFARIMAHAAAELGYDTADYEADIKAFAEALQTVGYDPESGYFSYVIHDENGDPKEFMRDENGVNYNMGLDGAYPLMAGVCTPEQQETLSNRIMSKEHMWTDIGISVVDQSAPYYKRDGYWNGSVWMPHQWFAFWGMLEYAYDEYAARIAETGLKTWKNEADYSYRCYEHFMVESRRGAGWHCFGGLSAPVVMWNASLYTPGHVTVPLNLRVTAQEETDTGACLRVAPVFTAQGECTVLYVPHNAVKSVTVNGAAVQPGKVDDALMIHVPKDAASEICICY